MKTPIVVSFLLITGIAAGLQAQSTATPASARPVGGGVPQLPGHDGAPPPTKPSVIRTTGDEDEMDDLDVQRRTVSDDASGAPVPAPRLTGSTVARPAGPGTVQPGQDGPPPVRPSIARTTGDEDEMDDLDVQRRVAPSDSGDKPLAAPTVAAAGGALAGFGPTERSILRGIALPGGRVTPPAPSEVARTTGDEDEMDDLDVQRRTAPGDLGDEPLPPPTLPVAAVGRDAIAIREPPPGPAAPGPAAAPAAFETPAGLPDAPKGVGPIARASVRVLASVVSPSDLVTIEFSGVPGNVHDWVCIAPAGAPDTDNGREWNYLKGATSGRHTFARLLPPGRYEVRVYADWPRGGHAVIARAPFEVR
jgi:hypothetical protein